MKYQDLQPKEAAQKPDFWCSIVNNKVKLKENHILYYSQVQGQMAVGQRPWCDFCIHTKKGIMGNRHSTQTDEFFYDCCLAPEIISPKYPLGIKLCDLRQES